MLDDGVIHIIDVVIELPKAPLDPCVSCFKQITIVEDVGNDTELSSFYQFLANSPVALTPPYTMFVPSDTFFYLWCY